MLVPEPGGPRDAPAVYAEADRLGAARGAAELERLRGELRGGTAAGAPRRSSTRSCSSTTSQPAALSLRPAIGEALAALAEAGAATAPW